MRRPTLLALAAGIGTVLAAGIAPPRAAANGRPPLTTGVAFRPGDDHAVYVGTTFGLLISGDDGCSFRWVCERAIGYSGEFDPKYAIAADGTIFATTFTGLRLSRDGGCTWSTATAEHAPGTPGRIAELWIDAIDIASTGDVWVASAESAAPNDIYRSTDNGRTFAPRGLASSTVWWKSVKVAPSNPRRVYVTGYQVAGMPRARLYRSDDAGANWHEQPLAGGTPAMKFSQTPIVLVRAIDPQHPDTLFVTSVEASPPKGDVLYRSTDGGAHFEEVLAPGDRIRDVVHAAGSVHVATLGGGAYRSLDGGATFSALAAPRQLACLGRRGDGTWFGCGANWEPDFQAIGRSRDLQRWDPVLRFVELAGPQACAPGTTTHDLCEPRWPALRALLGATGPPAACPPPPAAPAPVKRAPPQPRGGCCDAGAGSPIAPLTPLAAAAVLGVVVGRRRRRYRPSRQLA